MSVHNLYKSLFICLAVLVWSGAGFSHVRRLLEAELKTQNDRDTLNHIYETHNHTYVDRYFAGRRRLEQHMSLERRNVSHHSHKAWQAVAEVDGIKNSEIASFVTSTGSHGESLLWERIIPSARTWMRYFKNNYVIVEDNLLIRFALRQCIDRETAHYTVFECHDEATYILSRHCTDEYYGAAGPCCKVDDVFNFLTNDSPQLFAQIKYIVHGDDDTYWRVDQLMRFFGQIERAGISHLPIVGNARPGQNQDMGIWHINGCKEIMASGWMQPMMLNKAALERLRIPSAAYGLKDTCEAFVVTHDVGMEVYAWILQFYHVQLPSIEINGGHKGVSIFKPNLLAVHAIKHDDQDHCNNGRERDWPEALRYNQKVVVGCGDIDTKAPFHNPDHIADMYDAFHYFRDHGEDVPLGIAGVLDFVEARVTFEPNTQNPRRVKHILSPEEIATSQKTTPATFDGLPVETHVMPRVDYIHGYEKTAHAKKYDIVHKEWHVFTLKDCSPPGKVNP